MLCRLEFSPDTTPPELRNLAVRAEERRLPPPADAQYIYALVFPRYEEPRGKPLEFVKGLISALKTAQQRGIINVDLRESHVQFDPVDMSCRLIDWDCSVTVAAAAGRDALYARDGRQSCALDQPAVPLLFWDEVMNFALTLAPETLFNWLDRARHGCRFTPAVDIWHAGLALAYKLLGCNEHQLDKQNLMNASAVGNRGSVVHALVNLFGTNAFYAMLDHHGWNLGSSCENICEPAPGPLRFDPTSVRECVAKCESRTRIHPDLLKRKVHLPPLRLSDWCKVAQRPSTSRFERDLMHLVSQMLELNPSKRIDASRALKMVSQWPTLKGKGS